MANVFILLGGNVGDKSEIFIQTRKLILEKIGIVKKLSSVYETESWGFKSHPFWNQVIVLESGLDPFEILRLSQIIEKEMGSIKNSDGYEARTMDIDLLFYDDRIVKTPQLTIPHPGISARRFALMPLMELEPGKIHPVLGISISEMLDRCTDKLKVVRID